MEVRMNSSISNPLDVLFIFAFLHNFPFAFGSNRNRNGAAICPFSYFVEEVAEVCFSYLMRTTEENNTYRELQLVTYHRVVNYLLISYATGDVIAEGEADIMKHKQPQGLLAVYYLEERSEKALRSGQEYNDTKIKDGFT